MANGVTAVREMNTETTAMSIVQRWGEEVERGELVAPRVVAAGVAVRGSAEDEVGAARTAGADFIKIFSEMPEPRWRLILAEAACHRAAGVWARAGWGGIDRGGAGWATQ